MSLILTSTISCTVYSSLKGFGTFLLNKLAAFEVSTFNGYGFGSAVSHLESWTVLIQAVCTAGSALTFKSMNQYFKDRYYNEPGVTTPDVLNIFRTPFQFYMINQVWIRPFNEIRDYISTDFGTLFHSLISKEGAYMIINESNIDLALKKIEIESKEAEKKAKDYQEALEAKKTEIESDLAASGEYNKVILQLRTLTSNLNNLRIERHYLHETIRKKTALVKAVENRIKLANKEHEVAMQEKIKKLNVQAAAEDNLHQLEVRLQLFQKYNTGLSSFVELYKAIEAELKEANSKLEKAREESSKADNNQSQVEAKVKSILNFEVTEKARLEQSLIESRKKMADLEALLVKAETDCIELKKKMDNFRTISKKISGKDRELNAAQDAFQEASKHAINIANKKNHIANEKAQINSTRSIPGDFSSKLKDRTFQVTTFELAKGTFVYLMRALKLICTTNIQTRAREGYLMQETVLIPDDKGLKYCPKFLNSVGCSPMYRYFVRPLAFLGLFLILINLPITILCIINKFVLLSVDFLYSLVFKTTLSLTLMHFLYVIMTLLELVSYIRLVYRKLNEEFKRATPILLASMSPNLPGGASSSAASAAPAQSNFQELQQALDSPEFQGLQQALHSPEFQWWLPQTLGAPKFLGQPSWFGYIIEAYYELRQWFQHT